ncbi:MAG: error-prone DNA polymerase [Nocardioidaceae bacterium]
MGWVNPAVPWSQLERTLSGEPAPGSSPDEGPGSRKRKPYQPKPEVRPPAGPTTAYAELHCHSYFSFLDGASSPQELVEEAVRLGLVGLALTDHDGFYGAPAMAEAAQEYGRKHDLRTIYGAELSLGLTAPQNGVPDPGMESQSSGSRPHRGAGDHAVAAASSLTRGTQGFPQPGTVGGRAASTGQKGSHLLVLARGVEGYHRLSAAITDAQLAGDEKGCPRYDLDELAERAGDHWLVLTGCRKGMRTPEAVDALVDRFGRDNVVVELTDHGLPLDSVTNDALFGLAADRGLRVVATGNVHYARPDDHRVAGAMAAIRARRSLAEMDGWLPPGGGACLRSGAEMAARFARYPGAVARSVELAGELAFDLRRAKPALPKFRIPAGHDAASWLRVLVERGFEERYAHGSPKEVAKARKRIEEEMATILGKDFAGYFVIVHDIVEFARGKGILCQGRGSAAASAVCYALGVTAIDPVFYNLPFARFISAHRNEEPDIDVDFDSNRREEVIQQVYEWYGRRNAAQVANVISYRPKMAVRDAAKALGYSPGQQDAWSKQITSWSHVPLPDDENHQIPEPVLALAGRLLRAPRHLGIHSGGMILTERPIGDVCPIERARMDKRTVLQWDKDACEWMGLVKFDLLGLGMLSALDHMMRMVATHLGEEWTLATLPLEEPAVYDMLCRADSIGVFQVESRAQIGTLPRLRPRSFYELAIEIALIRPGPIQGGAVHPYIRRKTGQDPITYAHPDLEPVLGRTLGVPLFQEQLMAMAQALGDCSEDEADLLRRAMGSKRGVERIERVKQQLYKGMAARGITGEKADAIYLQILSFADFGFAESHALSFAKLVYASSWLKLHYPAAFLAGLLRAQPMGFYSAQSLVQDARRHGVRVLRPDLLRSAARADLELVGTAGPTGPDGCLLDHQGSTEYDESAPDPTPAHRRDTGYAVRLGFDSVRGIGTEVAERIAAARDQEPARGPITDLTELSRRAELDSTQLEALATAGVFDSLGLSRREALWQAGYTESPDQLPVTVAPAAPVLPGMDEIETTMADLWATGVTPDSHPFGHLRPLLRSRGIRAIGELGAADARRWLWVAGLITHRQSPSTAGSVTFLNLEDETGMLNVVCFATVWERHRSTARSAAAMVIRGFLEHQDGALNLVAEQLLPLERVYPDAGRGLQERHRSRDFR